MAGWVQALDELFGSKNKVLKKARKNLPKLQAALGSSHTVLWLGANDAYEPLSTAEIRWLAAKVRAISLCGLSQE